MLTLFTVYRNNVTSFIRYGIMFCPAFIGHARARDEEVVSASQVYFLPNPPRYPPPGQPPALSLRHIVDKVRKLSLSKCYSLHSLVVKLVNSQNLSLFMSESVNVRPLLLCLILLESCDCGTQN